eukprot:GHVH01001146.1.p1 GENE.GHVH01001146.1~~GHVH01001146.1.p1  ORF type:complete len:109 (+),score=17.25 GHVH01001146.1:534-860(+)
MGLIYISYFVPEDGDTQEQPNMFVVKWELHRLSDLEEAFTMPGKYHFRQFDAEKLMWIDIVDRVDWNLSSMKNGDDIVFGPLKVTRLAWTTKEQEEKKINPKSKNLLF